jgi:restriction system protein
MLKMHENSLFAVLLRAPWWASFVAATAVGVPARFALERFAMPEPYAIFIALPFLVIGCVAGWRQLRTPGPAKIADRLDTLRALSWEDFAARLATAYRRDGYETRRIEGAADLELEKSGRVTLVACKRWKASRIGIEPLRELQELRRKRDIAEAVYLTAGEITDTARGFAARSAIRLVEGPEIAALL